jgi:hypothetical protein
MAMSAEAENIPITPGRKTISIPLDRTGENRHIPLFSIGARGRVLVRVAAKHTDCERSITIL